MKEGKIIGLLEEIESKKEIYLEGKIKEQNNEIKKICNIKRINKKEVNYLN